MKVTIRSFNKNRKTYAEWLRRTRFGDFEEHADKIESLRYNGLLRLWYIPDPRYQCIIKCRVLCISGHLSGEVVAGSEEPEGLHTDDYLKYHPGWSKFRLFDLEGDCQGWDFEHMNPDDLIFYVHLAYKSPEFEQLLKKDL